MSAMTSTRPSSFPGTLTEPAELHRHYRQPTDLVQRKVIDHLDTTAAAFVRAASFVLVATTGPAGTDVSPRGGDPGFVLVLDDRRLVLPDLNGNNRLDTLRNVLVHPEVGLLFVIPGRDETLRVNGRAVVSIDEDLRAKFTNLRRPVSVLGVEVDECFVHCAKAFRRGGVWDPATWRADTAPTGAAILCAAVDEPGLTEDVLLAGLDEGYRRELALDRPE
jgi:uncharacterized protein